MTRTLIDTSYIVAVVSDRDENHERANRLVDEYDQKLLLVTDAVLLEIGNALSKNFKPEAVEIIENAFSSERIEVVRVNETLFDEGFELYKSHSDKTWGLVDCISFVVMRENNVTDALTSDKHFVQAGFRALMLDLEN